VQYALADLMCLGRTRKLVGSNWSSFSEAAGRLGGVSVYLSGVHFGRGSAPGRLGSAVSGVRNAFRYAWAKIDPFHRCKTANGLDERRRIV
jgi:hypothetical protein